MSRTLKCPKCGGQLRMISMLTEPEPIRAILESMGLPSTPPVPGRAKEGHAGRVPLSIACAASLLSRRIPREAFGARARQHVGHVLSAAKVTAAFDEWLAALRGRSQRVQPAS